jgi:hypothetical protein
MCSTATSPFAAPGTEKRGEAMLDHTKPEAVPEVRDIEEPTAELIREALDETRDLVRLEVALAREELKAEIAHAKLAGISLGSAAAAAVAAFTMFLVAIALAFRWSWLAALIIAGILLFLSGAMGFAGWISLPKRPMTQTRDRIESDLRQLRERVA